MNPYNTHAQDLVLPALAPGFYGYKEVTKISKIMMFIYSKRSAQLVTYPNGAQAPFDPNVALATAQHYAAKVTINNSNTMSHTLISSSW